MAVDMFLKLDSIKGESMDAKHKDEIEVLNWSWGMVQSASQHVGSGGGTGKISVQDLSFTHYVDKATVDMMQACTKGKHIKEGTLVVRKAGDKPLEYIKIKMEDIVISSIQPSGAGHDDRMIENVTLNFSKYKYIYTPQAKDGSGGSPAEFGWDIKKNDEG